MSAIDLGERQDPDVEKLADLFMDLRLDGPAADGWTYQQTARHYARIILGRWLAGIQVDPSDRLARCAAPVDRDGLREGRWRRGGWHDAPCWQAWVDDPEGGCTCGR